MTRAEMLEEMEGLKASIEKKVEDYNGAVLTSEYGKMAELNSSMTEDIKKYSEISRDATFSELKETEDPMLEAVKRLSFTVIAVKDKKEDGESIPVREVVERERQIDLGKLHRFIPGGIGVDKKWNLMIEKFNLLLTTQKAKDLGINPKEINDSYYIGKLAREFDLGKNPASKTNLLKTLTTIVQAMIGENYKPKSHDVNFLLEVYSKKSRKALAITVANHRYLRGYIMEICHKIITNKSYVVDYHKAKKD